jgi:hypothetical protein
MVKISWKSFALIPLVHLLTYGTYQHITEPKILRHEYQYQSPYPLTTMHNWLCSDTDVLGRPWCVELCCSAMSMIHCNCVRIHIPLNEWFNNIILFFLCVSAQQGSLGWLPCKLKHLHSCLLVSTACAST